MMGAQAGFFLAEVSMGLRIVDRHVRGKIELTEPERLGFLAATAAAFESRRAETALRDEVKGPDSPPAQSSDAETFWTRYHRAHATMSPPGVAPESARACALEVTDRVCESILGRKPASALSHTKVDIATLLTLL